MGSMGLFWSSMGVEANCWDKGSSSRLGSELLLIAKETRENTTGKFQ